MRCTRRVVGLLRGDAAILGVPWCAYRAFSLIAMVAQQDDLAMVSIGPLSFPHNMFVASATPRIRPRIAFLRFP